MTVQEMKEKLRDGEIKSYQWVTTKQMWTNGLTKEMEMADGLRKFLKTGRCEIVKEEVNKVIVIVVLVVVVVVHQPIFAL